MSDHENKRGSRDNTDRPYKPEEAQNYENAPRGHLGAGGPGNPAPGLGNASPSPDVTKALEEGQAAQSPEQPDQRTQQEDHRPVIVETGDDEVDQFYSQDNRVVDQDLSAFVREDDPRPVFVETGNDEVDQFYAQDNRMIAQDTEFASLIERRYSDMTADNDIGDEGISGQRDDGI